MVDIDAAVGFVVARGDVVARARLSRLRTGAAPGSDIFDNVEAGLTGTGGWPALGGDPVASIDATCFRLAELDDLDGLHRPAATRALTYLASQQRLDGSWEEDASLARTAPPWAKPGDPEARFFLTANAAYWLAVAARDQEQATGEKVYELALSRAARAILDSLDENGAWPGYLVSGWLAAAVLHRTEWFYEAARMFVILTDRVRTMSAADAAQMTIALRRAGVSVDDNPLLAAREHLAETQRPDGAWPSADTGDPDVNTTLNALRALR